MTVLALKRLGNLQISLIEGLFGLQSQPNGLVDQRVADQVVVVQVGVEGVDPVDPTMRLPPIAVGVRLRVEANRIRGHTIPAFRARSVLNQVQPARRFWNILVLVTVPLLYHKLVTIRARALHNLGRVPRT